MLDYKSILESLKVISEVDVLVLGGGTAGTVAAISAAREKVKTLVVEQFGFLGGTQTAALVTPMMPNQIEQEPLNRGIDWEINSRMMETGESGRWPDGNMGWFNPEMLKIVLEQMVVEAGADILYYTMFEDSIMDGNDIRGVTVLNKGGRGTILARRVVDATGDADVAFGAGAPFFSGDEKTFTNQPFSIRFSAGGVDLNRFISFLESLGRAEVTLDPQGSTTPLIHTAMVWGRNFPLEPVFRKAVEDGVLLETDGNYFQAFTVAGRHGELFFNCPRITLQVDGTNPSHLTRAQILGRQAILRYLAFVRKYFPGCEHASITSIAPMVGVRESRRIDGEYFLTVDDILSAKKFQDAIARSNYPIDVHSSDDRSGMKLQHLPPGTYYEIPYRCIVPKKVENLLVPGRCLSASFEAQGSVRIQTNCRAMGEAAGLASSMSLERSISPRQVNGSDLRQALRQKGASL
jgi:hypothetical protein